MKIGHSYRSIQKQWMTGAEELETPPAGIASKIHDGLQPLIVFEPCFGSNPRFVAAVAVADELSIPA